MQHNIIIEVDWLIGWLGIGNWVKRSEP